MSHSSSTTLSSDSDFSLSGFSGSSGSSGSSDSGCFSGSSGSFSSDSDSDSDSEEASTLLLNLRFFDIAIAWGLLIEWGLYDVSGGDASAASPSSLCVTRALQHE